MRYETEYTVRKNENSNVKEIFSSVRSEIIIARRIAFDDLKYLIKPLNVVKKKSAEKGKCYNIVFNGLFIVILSACFVIHVQILVFCSPSIMMKGLTMMRTCHRSLDVVVVNVILSPIH